MSPVLWSFRRCPYAIRARLAIASAGTQVELREIVLRDKPEAFRAASPSATVPALQLADGVIDESRDIMIWALQRHDPQRLLEMPEEGWTLIERNDGPFKTALDHTKYASRHPNLDVGVERGKASEVLYDLDARLKGRSGLFGDRQTVADLALLPFVRQFANTDMAWFEAQPWPDLIAWLARFTTSAEFAHVMAKYPPWAAGDAPTVFS